MNNTKEKIFLYARKSTNRKDNQIESLPDQIKALEELAKERNLNIAEIIQEAKSAKKPYIRPEFTKMVERIRKGEANVILCWKLDRLARNPVDAGTISWMLQEGIIKKIITFEKEYLPEDNVLMMSVEMGMANQYVKDLSVNVSRSVLSKFERGEYPSRAPVGYANFRESKKRAYIISDPDRFALVRKLWDLMLTGTYNPMQICDIAEKWELRTKPRPKHTPKKISYSLMYKTFTNIFYAGYLEYRGTQYKAKHEAMVTLEEFDRVQKLLGSKGKQRAQTREFPYTGAMFCKECGCSITAETKPKLLKRTGVTKEYTYYHCTHKKRDYHCSKRGSSTKEKLEAQILDKIGETQMFPEFYEFAISRLKLANQNEFIEKGLITKSLHESVLKCDEKLERLLDSKIEGLVDSKKYVEKKTEINNEKALALEKLDSAENKITNWAEKLEKIVDFVTYAKINFIHGTDLERREIFIALGKNLTMDNGLLNVGDRFWREPFKEISDFYKQKIAELEPAIVSSSNAEIVPTEALKQKWWTRQESNLRPPQCK